MIKNTPELKRRALAAYFRFSDANAPQPDSEHTECHEIDGKHYVCLGHRGGLLACFRVRNDGKLKRLIRVPEQLRY